MPTLSNNVTHSTHEIQERLEEDRQAIGTTLDHLRSRLREGMNVRRQLSEHAVPTLAVAAALGFIVGRGIRMMFS